MKFHIKRANLEFETNTEVTFLLPTEDVDKFSNLFKALDNSKHDMGVLNYGITSTSLEEVCCLLCQWMYLTRAFTRDRNMGVVLQFMRTFSLVYSPEKAISCNLHK